MHSELLVEAMSDLVNILAGTKIESELVFGQNGHFLRRKLASEYEDLFIDAMGVHLLHFPHKTISLVNEMAELSRNIRFKFPWKIDLLAMEAPMETGIITPLEHQGYSCLVSLKHILHHFTRAQKGQESDETLFALSKGGMELFWTLEGSIKQDFTCLCENSLVGLMISAPERFLLDNLDYFDRALDYILGQPTMGIEGTLFQIQVLVSTGRSSLAVRVLDKMIKEDIRAYTPEIPTSEMIICLNEEWVRHGHNRISKLSRKSLPWFRSRSEEYWKHVLKILQEEVEQ
ncbi:hypothetical protein OAT73_05390 [Candidatus Poseidoniaceae archaeon]|nr:hypothetical protein [Candidatus Poseidoniaceae archaeon]